MIAAQQERLQTAIGRIELQLMQQNKNTNPQSHEFQVFSQWGEDGILQHLLQHAQIQKHVFVEFGVEDYTEANTRFILQNNYWSGLVLDSSQTNIEKIRASELYWKFNLKAETAMITTENINDVLSKNGLSGEIGILSIDIDGNDYWVWKAIDVVQPAIVVCEYNSLWGAKNSVTVPYSANFQRSNEHYSNLYFGASIQALTDLAEQKGYALVASNKAGCNLFFVRKDRMGDLNPQKAEDTYVQSGFRESRGKNGELTHLDFSERRALIANFELLDTRANRKIKISELS